MAPTSSWTRVGLFLLHHNGNSKGPILDSVSDGTLSSWESLGAPGREGGKAGPEQVEGELLWVGGTTITPCGHQLIHSWVGGLRAEQIHMCSHTLSSQVIAFLGKDTPLCCSTVDVVLSATHSHLHRECGSEAALIRCSALCACRGNMWSALTRWMDPPTSTAWLPLGPSSPSTGR